ncbi:MAG: TlpA family protein disulfide reductase [Deltaproteobacteria bacterium]|nr:TlpA family protein disulfide reductase [Deltaproteobacteria bacterium]
MRGVALTGLVLLTVAGCGNPPPTSEQADAYTPPMDDAYVAPLCENVPPATANFGSLEGRILEGFTLPQCNNEDYTLYGEDFCDPEHTLTVISIAAEWCGPCQEESRQLTDLVVRPYADRGVRVIQIIIQDADYGPPDLDLCNRWVTRFGLTDNIEVIDPTGVTSGAFPSGSLPSTVILDETGTIIHREDGAAPGLVTLRAELDAALADR